MKSGQSKNGPGILLNSLMGDNNLKYLKIVPQERFKNDCFVLILIA